MQRKSSTWQDSVITELLRLYTNHSRGDTDVKITSGKGYFIDTINPGGDNLYTADQTCRMIEFFIDNIFVKFGRCLFHLVIGDSN